MGFSFWVHYKLWCGQTSFPVNSAGSCWSQEEKEQLCSTAPSSASGWGVGHTTWHGKLQNKLPNSWEALTVKWAHQTPVNVGSTNTSFILGSFLSLLLPLFCLHWCYTDFFPLFDFPFPFFSCLILVFSSSFNVLREKGWACNLLFILELHFSALIIFPNCEQFQIQK